MNKILHVPDWLSDMSLIVCPTLVQCVEVPSQHATGYHNVLLLCSYDLVSVLLSQVRIFIQIYDRRKDLNGYSMEIKIHCHHIEVVYRGASIFGFAIAFLIFYIWEPVHWRGKWCKIWKTHLLLVARWILTCEFVEMWSIFSKIESRMCCCLPDVLFVMYTVSTEMSRPPAFSNIFTS